MANRQWIKLDRSICRNIKVRKLAYRLKLRPVHAVAHLVALWCACFEREETERGDLSSIGVDGVELNAEWEGENGLLFTALVDVGLLKVTRNNERILVHDWEEYAGAYLKNRDSARGRMKKMRDRKAVTRNNEDVTRKFDDVTLNVLQTDLRSTASASGAVEASNQSRATAARADQPPADDPRLPVDAEFYEQLQRDTDAVHASFAPSNKNQPTPKTQIAPQGCPAQQTQPPASNLPASVPQQPSMISSFLPATVSRAPEPTAPVAEIVDQAGLTLNKVIDLFRTGHYGQVIRVNHSSRARLGAVLSEHYVDAEALDEAFARAADYHREENGTLGGRVEVYATTVAKCLQTVCNHRKKQMDLQANIVGAVRGEQLATQQNTPLAKLGGGLTRQEAAKVRSDTRLMEFALRKDKENKEREARKKLQAAKQEM